MSYTCQSCGAKSKNHSTLCNPSSEEPDDNFCGIPEEWVCEGKLPTLEFVCETCGSLSASSKHLCRPKKAK